MSFWLCAPLATIAIDRHPSLIASPCKVHQLEEVCAVKNEWLLHLVTPKSETFAGQEAGSDAGGKS